MKNKFVIIIYLISLTLIRCTETTNPYSSLRLPDSSVYNEIVLEIIKQDTATFNGDFLKKEYISDFLSKTKIVLRTEEPDTTNAIVEIAHGDFRTWIPELNYYGITNTLDRASDSLFFAFQNDSTNNIQLDTNAFKNINLATKKIKAKRQQERYFGYYQFSLPILNKNITKAFIRADFICNGLCGDGKIYVLEKTNNKWAITLKKTTWVG